MILRLTAARIICSVGQTPEIAGEDGRLSAQQLVQQASSELLGVINPGLGPTAAGSGGHREASGAPCVSRVGASDVLTPEMAASFADDICLMMRDTHSRGSSSGAEPMSVPTTLKSGNGNQVGPRVRTALASDVPPPDRYALLLHPGRRPRWVRMGLP